jgi:DNA gyrase subunit A
VTGDTLVRLAEGSTERIADLAPGAEPHSDTPIDVKLADRRAQPVAGSMVLHSGTQSTLRITSREGYELTGTPNHPILCLVSVAGVPMLLWKLLSEVRPGDRAVMLRRPADDVGLLSDDDSCLAVLAGAFVAEGWISETRAGFDNVQRLDHVLRSPLAEMVGARSAAKAIPSSVWPRSAAFKALFLRSLFEGDGSKVLGARSSIQISYSRRCSSSWGWSPAGPVL